MRRLIIALLIATSAHALGAEVTAYCACRLCCGQWAIRKPETASGTIPTQGRTVAGPRAVRFGTRVLIEGVGVRVVEDRLARKFDGRWDVFYDDHAAAKAFGKRKLRVTILSR